MRKNTYNGKVALLVDYHWDNDEKATTILSGEFPTVAQALQDMKKAMPSDAEFDDGYDFDEWNEHEPSNVFASFVSYTADNGKYFLATFTPIIEEGGAQ